MGYLTNALAKVDLKILVILFGSIWAVYKFIQRGFLHPLLDLKVSGKLIKLAEREFLLCDMEVKNVHIPMVRIEYAGLRLFSMQELVNDDAPSPPVVWKKDGTFPVFEGQRKIWSDELIRDRLLLVAPSDQGVFKVEFRIGRKYKWYQYFYRWFTGRNAWLAVAIVTRDPQPERG